MYVRGISGGMKYNHFSQNIVSADELALRKNADVTPHKNTQNVIPRYPDFVLSTCPRVYTSNPESNAIAEEKSRMPLMIFTSSAKKSTAYIISAKNAFVTNQPRQAFRLLLFGHHLIPPVR